MGNTRDTGYLRNLVIYDGSGNITLPANLTVTSNVAINNTTPHDTTQFSLDINGGLIVKNTGKTAQFVIINSNPATGGNHAFVQHTVGGTSGSSYADIQGYYGLAVTGSTVIRLNPLGGNVLIGSLVGTGTRVVVASSTGVLSTQAAQTIGDLNGVPTSRTITINGTTQDLSANRSFTINSMVYPGAGIAVSTGSAWGTSLTDNSSNWNTAFGWGNHAGLYSLLNHTHTFASLTSKPTTLVGYGITDAATSAQGTSADTAYGWGNHASGGYVTLATAQTISGNKTFSGSNSLFTGSATFNSALQATIGIIFPTSGTVSNGAGVVGLGAYTGGLRTAFNGGYTSDLAFQMGANYVYTFPAASGTIALTSDLSTYATQTYVGTQIANLVASSPAALDTLNELAAALGNDAAFSTTVSTALGNRLRVDINTQGLSATLQGYGRTNLGLGTAATSNTGDFVAYRTFGTAANSATGDFVAYRTFGTAANNNTGDFAAASHTHSIANVTGLQTALDGKQASGSYAASSHSHIISDVTGLQTALDGKQASLGFTPYNSTNPSGYISSYTETDTLQSVILRNAATNTGFTIENGNSTYSTPASTNVPLIYIHNTSTNANGHAILSLRSMGPSGGDPFLSLDIDGVIGWHVGVDNSDDDTFKIGKSWATVGSNTYLSITTSGNTTFGGTIAATNFSGTHSGSSSGTNTGDQTNISGNAATATNVAYSGLTGTVPTWNQNTTGTAANSTLWNGAGYSYTATSTVNSYILGLSANGDWRPMTTAAIQSWLGLGSLAYSSATIPTNNNQLTNGAGYITGYTETDTLASVTGRGASTSTALSINNTLTVTNGRLTVRTGGANTYGIVSGYDNNNHMMTFRADVTGPTASPTYTAGHQMTFIEYAQAGDTTGWFFKSSSSTNYEEIARITRAGATFSGTISASNYSGTHSGSSSGTNTGDQTTITGNAGTATILKSVGTTTGAASTWNPQGLTYQAWGQAFINTSISGDSGDIVMWLRAAQYPAGGAEVCLIIDGDYYAGTGAHKVLHAGNYNSYALPLGGGTISGNVNFTSTQPLSFTGASQSGTFNQTALYINQNSASGNTANGIFIERGRLSDAGGAEVRYFTIGARGGQIQWQCDGVGNTTQYGGLTATGADSNFGPDSGGDNGIRIRYGNNNSGYGRIRFHQDGTNHNTIHSFAASWQGGSFIGASAGALNISGQYGVTFGGWNTADAHINTDGIYVKAWATPSGSTGWNANSVLRLQQGSTGNDVYIEMRNRADVGDHAAILFTDNNVGGYIGFRTYASNNVAAGSDCMIYGTYNDHIFQNGSSGVFNGKTETFRIYANGSVRATGDITAYSDRRVKENIITIDKALEKTLQLRGVFYNRTDKDDKSQKVGVIAQEIQEILPQVVNEDYNGLLSVSYGNITGLLIEAVKEQQTQIESQKSEIEELKDLVKQLINR